MGQGSYDVMCFKLIDGCYKKICFSESQREWVQEHVFDGIEIYHLVKNLSTWSKVLERYMV